MEKEKLRPVSYSGHMSGGKGYFHKFTELHGKPHAIIENEHGVVSQIDISVHNFKFTDRENVKDCGCPSEYVCDYCR